MLFRSIQRLADTVSGWFVPAVVAVAAIAFIAWSLVGPSPAMGYGLIAAVAVLIIACPCALGLATPMSIMVVTMFGDEANMMRAFEAGARGYLLKDGTEEDLVEHVMSLHAGGSPMTPIIARQLLVRLSTAKAAVVSACGSSPVSTSTYFSPEPPRPTLARTPGTSDMAARICCSMPCFLGRAWRSSSSTVRVALRTSAEPCGANGSPPAR